MKWPVISRTLEERDSWCCLCCQHPCWQVLSEDMGGNVAELNQAFKDVGLTGKTVELTLDGENLLGSLFRNALKAQNCPVVS